MAIYLTPWAAFAINLRFLYSDDEWAGTPDPDRGLEARATINGSNCTKQS